MIALNVCVEVMYYIYLEYYIATSVSSQMLSDYIVVVRWHHDI